MIVSHEHRFIFVKTRKTAGTSIEVFLSKFAGDDAIVTPTIPAVEGHQPRNYNPTRLAMISRLHLGREYWNHMPARKIRARLGPVLTGPLWHHYRRVAARGTASRQVEA